MRALLLGILLLSGSVTLWGSTVDAAAACESITKDHNNVVCHFMKKPATIFIRTDSFDLWKSLEGRVLAALASACREVDAVANVVIQVGKRSELEREYQCEPGIEPRVVFSWREK